MQTMGDVWPFWRLIGVFLAHQNKASFDFLCLNADPLTSVYHGLHVMAIGWKLRGAWQARMWGCMMNPGRGAAYEHVKRKNMKYMGGPGNRTQVPAFTK